MAAVNWPLVLRVARAGMGELPEVSRVQAQQVVADVRVRARQAEGLAREYSGLAVAGCERILAVDRAGWLQAAVTMAATVVDRIELPKTGSDLATSGFAGVLLGRVSRNILGQFDPFAARPTLYLVAPNLLQLERLGRLAASQFRLYVAVHEQTHALQTAAAPWLTEYLLQRFAIIAMDEPGLLEGLGGVVSGRGLTALWASADAASAVAEVLAAMTFLEGHAEYVADLVGQERFSDILRIRRVLSGPERPNLLAQLVPGLDKQTQYRTGRDFCERVVSLTNMGTLTKAFASPSQLPTAAEIADPRSWLERIDGAA